VTHGYGTVKGVKRAPLQPGDVVEVESENVDELRTATARAEPHAFVASELLGPRARSNLSDSKRRFTLAVLIGLAVAALPYLWVLFDLWNGSFDLLRTAESNGYASNFYDLQARAIFHGHLYAPDGAFGGEAFVHAGHAYTYFGLFPSLLRMPVLALTHSLDGRLTALSMLLAWLVTALFSSLLIWRVRPLIRGNVAMGRAEAASYGVLLATIMGGSVLVYLASDPWVFSEDLAWSVALTVGSMFALLGVLERPSWGRVIASGAVIMAASLTRASTGDACVIGAVLVAIWFAIGRGGAANRRWWPWVLASGLVPLAVGCAITWAKFGILFGYPASEQIVFASYFHNASPFGVRYLPGSLVAYFQPIGLRLTPVFPFITLPSIPAHGFGGAPLFETSRVGSVPDSMPLLFFMGLWGVVSVFRRGPGRQSALLRPVLVAAFIGCGTVLIYGSLVNRFVGDFVPFLVVAAAVGLVEIWRLLENKRRRARMIALAAITAFGAFGIAANVGMAITPNDTWNGDQLLRYVEAQNSVSHITGNPLSENVVRGNSLPDHAPADELYVAGNCDALYISDADLPPFQPRSTNIKVLALELAGRWRTVEQGPAVRHTLNITFHGPVADIGTSVPVISLGTPTVSSISVEPYGTGAIRFSITGSSPGTAMQVQQGRTYQITFVTDPYLHYASVTSQQGTLLTGAIFGGGPVVVHTTQSGPVHAQQPMTVTEPKGAVPNVSLCRSLK
jgi:hypothetical protein